MKFKIVTFGCKVNQYESQAIAELLMENGYGQVGAADTPDIVIINSCSVTAESDRKVRNAVRKYRAKYEDAIIILSGCMTSAIPSTEKDLPEADIIMGNREYKVIPSLINEYLDKNERLVSIEKHEKGERYSPLNITDFSEHTRAFMKIEDGCDRYCTYCIIPYARGFVRSRSIEDIKNEAEALAKKGYKEIVLVGINLSSFGKDTGSNLAVAVKTVAEVSGIKRVRLGSLEPDLMTNELLYSLKEIDKFCPQFHLSLQSGSDKTLKRMNRHYDSAFYYDLVERIRNIFYNPAITTDIMVGFAGETEEEFNESILFAKKVGFAKSHIFAYSKRKGTAAEKLGGHLSNAVKAERSRKMIELTRRSEQEFLNSQIGKTAMVLFEEYENGRLKGFTENYITAFVSGESVNCGEIKKIRIIDTKEDYVVGEII